MPLSPTDFLVYQRERRTRLKAERRCACGHRLYKAKLCCTLCRRKLRAYRRRLRKARNELGLCHDCGLPSEHSRRVCVICRYKRRMKTGDEAPAYGAGPRGCREREANRLGFGVGTD